MKKKILSAVILMSVLMLSACGPHHHAVKPKPVVLVPQVKHVVYVKPVKIKYYRRWHH